MEILSLKHLGLWFICEQCSALIVNIQENEIYEDNAVYCPVCHFKNLILYYKKYNGIVNKEVKNV